VPCQVADQIARIDEVAAKTHASKPATASVAYPRP
jgi:hypothetical protein